MKRHLLSFMLPLFALAACEKPFEEQNLPEGNLTNKPEFTAEMEAFGTQSKTAINDQLEVIWKQDDEVTIFQNSTLNDRYQLKSGEETTKAIFSIINSENNPNGDYFAGVELPHNIAVYPYSDAISVKKEAEGYLVENLSIPALQIYTPDSFDAKAFPMIAVSENNGLKFKNAAGMLKLLLKGTGSVTAVTILGKNEEALAGTVTLKADGINAPILAPTPDGSKFVTLKCTEPVVLSETPTAFMIVLPPMDLSKGFLVRVDDVYGTQQLLNAPALAQNKIVRNQILTMPAIEYKGTRPVAEDNAILTKWAEGITPPNINGFTGESDPITGYYKYVSTTAITSIPESSFNQKTSLLEVILPTSVTSIGNFAFDGCTELSFISGMENVESIGAAAFRNCSALGSIQPLLKLNNLQEEAFASCSSLKTAVFSNKLTTIGNAAFSESGLEEIVLPTDTPLTSIPSGIFSKCSFLASFTIPNAVMSIGSRAFESCSSLTTIDIPSNVTEIQTNAFSSCSKLNITGMAGIETLGNAALQSTAVKTISLPKLKSLGNSVFEYCKSLTSVSLPDSYQQTMIPSGVFHGCDLLSAFTIPASVTAIESNAFQDCIALNDIKLPDGLLEIWQSAFEGCTGITSLKIPSKVGNVHRSAFANTSINHLEVYSPNLAWDFVSFDASAIDLYLIKDWKGNKDVNETESVWKGIKFKSINFINADGTPAEEEVAAQNNEILVKTLTGDKPSFDLSAKGFTLSATADANGWWSYKSTKEITEITDGLFQGLQDITHVQIPETVTRIGNDAFGCSNYPNNKPTSLVSINIPDGLKIIGEYAFYNCVNLTEITLPEGLEVIGNGAFMRCESLVLDHLPSTIKVTNLGDKVFLGCSSIISFTLPDNMTNLPDDFFSECSSLTTVNLTKVQSIGKRALESCTSLESIVLPSTVTKLSHSCFRYCSKLKNIQFPENDSIELDAYVFKGCTSLKEVVFNSKKLSNIDRMNVWSSTSLNSITLNPRCEEVGAYMFEQLPASVTVTIPENSQLRIVSDYAFNTREKGYKVNILGSLIHLQSLGNYALYINNANTIDKIVITADNGNVNLGNDALKNITVNSIRLLNPLNKCTISNTAFISIQCKTMYIHHTHKGQLDQWGYMYNCKPEQIIYVDDNGTPLNPQPAQ